MREDWGGLFSDGTICRGSLFWGQNTKTGPGGARSLVGNICISETVQYRHQILGPLMCELSYG